MRRYRFGAVLLVAWALAACAITFGEGPAPDDLSREEQLRRQNLLYREEQERLERLRQGFGAIGSER